MTVAGESSDSRVLVIIQCLVGVPVVEINQNLGSGDKKQRERLTLVSKLWRFEVDSKEQGTWFSAVGSEVGVLAALAPAACRRMGKHFVRIRRKQYSAICRSVREGFTFLSIILLALADPGYRE